MNAALQPLLDLQEQDTQRLQKEGLLRDLPTQIAACQQKILIERALIEADAKAFHALELKRRELDQELKNVETSINRYKNQQLEVKKNEEYIALTHQIETAQAQARTLEDAELNFLIEIDAAKLRLETTQKAHEAQIKLWEGQIQMLEEQLHAVKGEITELTQLCERLSAAVDREALKGYQKVRTYITRPPFVVPVRDHRCQGCFLKVSNEEVSQILHHNLVVFCSQCGRMIYAE